MTRIIRFEGRIPCKNGVFQKQYSVDVPYIKDVYEDEEGFYWEGYIRDLEIRLEEAERYWGDEYEVMVYEELIECAKKENLPYFVDVLEKREQSI